MTESHSPKAPRTGVGANLPLVVFFAVSLFMVWSWLYAQQNAGILGAAGSDSFLVVERIFKAHELQWFEQRYVSQFGLQSMILSALYKLLGNTGVAQFALVAVQVFCLLTAVAWALAAPLVQRKLGAIGVIVLWSSLAASPWLMAFAHSLYWAQFTLVLPFTWAMTCGAMMHSGNLFRRRFLLGMSLLIFVKSLCGYEYISTITLLACAGYAVAALDHSKKPTLGAFAAVFLACVTGFFAAFAAHSAQLIAQFGMDGLQHILGRVTLHSGTGADSGRADILISLLEAQPGMQASIQSLLTDLASHQWLFFKLSFIQYFRFVALQFTPAIVIPLWPFALIGCAALLWSCVVIYRHRRGNGASALPATAMWCFATALALLAAVSWQVLAWRHMTVHYHLNGLVFAMGLVPLGSLWIVSLAVRTIDVPRAWRPFWMPALAHMALVLGALAVAGRFQYADRQALTFEAVAAAGTPSTIHASLDAVVQTAAVTELARGLSLPATRIVVAGWAYSVDSGAVEVELRVDGVVIAGVRTHIPRQDVAAAFPKAPPDSGFEVSAIIPASLSSGRLEVILMDEHGSQRRFLR
jgi:hypothetical protein